MMHSIRLYFLCGILILLPQLRLCRRDARKERAIDFPMQWRPVQMSPSASGLHMIPGGGGSDGHQHLISITNFDGTNKAQLAQIAHHNAQILRHIKRVPGVPVTQYHNPFPIFGTAIGGGSNGVGSSSSSGGILSTSGSGESHAQPHHLSHQHHHHHPFHSGPGVGAVLATGGSPPGPGKHFIVQTSNVIVHPQPVPHQAAIVSAITSAPLVHAHPNSLLTSSSNMAQTMVPYGHHHKHQYFSAKHPPAFLLGKPAEGNGGGGGAFKFLNAIHPSTMAATTTASGAKNYATAALIKGAVSLQPIFSSTTSRIPIIRDSTLTPLTFHRHTTVKPHPVVGKLQTHLALGTRPKSQPSGPGGPHSLDELSAHQSHLISSLAQFGTPNFVRTAAGSDSQQKLPRPNQGPPFSPLPPIDHLGHYLGKNYANQVRFPSNQQQQQQQQQHHQQQHQQNQFRAQILQQQHHQQQLQHQQQQHQQQQQQQQVHQQQQQQEQLRQQQHQQQIDQQLQQQQQEQHQFQQQQKHQYQQQQQQAAAQVAHNNQQQQQSQQEETYYMPPSSNDHNHTKPVYEPNQSLEQILRDFDVPFKQMPSFGDTQTTRSPNAYLPPSSLPSLSPSHSPSILSPFFHQQIHQQKNQELEQADQHDDRQQHSHKDIHSNDASDTFQPSNPAGDLLPHFFISSTFAPSPHVVQIQPTADDFLSHNLSFHHAFPSDAITYHTQHLDIQPQQPPQQQQHNVPPFTRIEDEFTLNLVPPPSYAKDTSQFRRPQASRGPPSTAFPHLQQQNYHHNDAVTEHIKALEILNKYNIPAISPLQDANRFAYNAAIANSNNKGHHQKNAPTITSSLAPPAPTLSQFHTDSSAAHPTTSLKHFTTEKPNVFRNLNRPSESEYKQHKVMHPSYTGGPKRPAANNANITNSKPEAVTANPALTAGGNAVTHSFFTIEDAVTLSPQLNHAHRNAGGVRPTANHNQIEASLNRPREEEITEVITMRATSEDDELLQHLDVSSTTRAPMRPKHRRRRPRPSSTSTTERRPEEEANEDEETDDLQQQQQPHNRPNYLEEQGHWETNRFPSNHRETSAEPTSSTRPAASTTTPQHMSRHRTRTRGGGGRPTVTVLQEGGIVLEKPIRSRNRPTQRPDEASPTPSRTRATSQSTTAARTTATSAETTENYEEPTTMNLRDNIFLANLKQRRRPPHSTKATTFVSSTPSPTLPTDFQQYGGRGGPPQQQQTIATGGYVTEIGEDTFMTTRATKPAGNQQTTHIYGQALGNNDIQSTFDFEEITLASDIAQTVSTQVTIAPAEQQDVTDVFTTAVALPVVPPLSSSTTITLSSSSSSTDPAAIPTNHQTQSTVAELPAIEASAAPNHKHRLRHRLRPKDHHTKQIAHNEIHASSTADTNSMDEQQVMEDAVTPTKFSVRPVSVRLPIIKTTGTMPVVLDSTTTRTTISVDDSPLQSPNKNLRPTGAIQKFDPKNRPRFSVKEYRQRLSSSTPSTPASSDTSSSSISTTPTSTTRLRYPTRSRVLPDLRLKPTRSSAQSEEPTIVSLSTTSERNDEPIAATTEDSSRKRFIPKERRNKSTASNEVFSSSERSNGYGQTTPSTTSSRGSTVTTTARTTRSRSPSTSRRAFSSTTTAAPTVSVTRTPTIRKFPGGPSLRRPSQPSLRQRIALSQQKMSSTEATIAAASTLVSVMQPQTTTPGSINKLFNVDESEQGFTPDVENLNVDDIDMSDSVNTENYKLETAIMKIAKDDHSYRPYSITPRTRSRTSSTTTESLFFGGHDDDPAENQLSVIDVDMNGSPSEQSERVADLTRFGTNHFQSVNTAAGSATSRRIPGYFTLATEDPILPIEAFFPKMSNGMRG